MGLISKEGKRNYKGAFAFALFGSFTVLVGAMVLRSQVVPVDPEEGITVLANGDAVQARGVVARLRPDGSIAIPLVTPKTAADAVRVRQGVTFKTEDDASERVTPRIVSIQGDENASFVWDSGSELNVFAGTYVPDSQTYLVLTATPGTFSPGVTWWIAGFAQSISWLDGLALGCAIFALAFLLMRRALKGPAWKVTTPANTPPIGLTPAELAVLHHGSIEADDFLAFVFNLAQRGYLQFIEQGEDVILLRSSLQEGLSPHERGILALMFPLESRPVYLGELLKSFKDELFSAAVSQLYVEIYSSFNGRQFFAENPRITHLRYKTAAILIQGAGLISLAASALGLGREYPATLPVAIALYAAGLYVYKRAKNIIRYSENANSYISEAAAFVGYLILPRPIGAEGAHGERFYQYAPYAIAVRAVPQWLARFNETSWYIPTWYVMSNGSIVEPEVFMKKVGDIVGAIARVFQKVRDPNAD